MKVRNIHDPSDFVTSVLSVTCSKVVYEPTDFTIHLQPVVINYDYYDSYATNCQRKKGTCFL